MVKDVKSVVVGEEDAEGRVGWEKKNNILEKFDDILKVICCLCLLINEPVIVVVFFECREGETEAESELLWDFANIIHVLMFYADGKNNILKNHCSKWLRCH